MTYRLKEGILSSRKLVNGNNKDSSLQRGAECRGVCVLWFGPVNHVTLDFLLLSFRESPLIGARCFLLYLEEIKPHLQGQKR